MRKTHKTRKLRPMNADATRSPQAKRTSIERRAARRQKRTSR
jgi:hypothetical protein